MSLGLARLAKNLWDRELSSTTIRFGVHDPIGSFQTPFFVGCDLGEWVAE